MFFGGSCGYAITSHIENPFLFSSPNEIKFFILRLSCIPEFSHYIMFHVSRSCSIRVVEEMKKTNCTCRKYTSIQVNGIKVELGIGTHPSGFKYKIVNLISSRYFNQNYYIPYENQTVIERISRYEHVSYEDSFSRAFLICVVSRSPFLVICITILFPPRFGEGSTTISTTRLYLLKALRTFVIQLSEAIPALLCLLTTRSTLSISPPASWIIISDSINPVSPKTFASSRSIGANLPSVIKRLISFHRYLHFLNKKRMLITKCNIGIHIWEELRV